ncbi:DUF2062 domain-containing protein [Syntrophus aciditrophicus]|jgi:uncharacterized protein (DUF2062 family)|uniref:Hypothetical membrane protein n=1 Tax=Syntrophus aciditrophicus (strain SB) TaxID=56780 RepID=Q2LSQ2_SYNAS|nr:DUF2062 domain-containing protein [Syntrophus aciditrophicus]ABC77112.1 hypothetical membrane protein [Syntrophus aciditrophicus SB]OPY18222.1 MAG: hypothetical protein A4E74_00712 [Syntrophus sp. PtaB.Bin075]
MIFENRIKKFYQQFISLKGDPESLAWGMAMGVFIGVTPTIPFHTVLIVFFGFLLKKNMTSAFLGSSLISNPVTIPLLYLSEYQIGRLILGPSGAEIRIKEYTVASILQLGWEVAVPLLLGGFLLGLVFTYPAYFLSYRLLSFMRKKEAYDIRSTDSP